MINFGILDRCRNIVKYTVGLRDTGPKNIGLHEHDNDDVITRAKVYSALDSLKVWSRDVIKHVAQGGTSAHCHSRLLSQFDDKLSLLGYVNIYSR